MHKMHVGIACFGTFTVYDSKLTSDQLGYKHLEQVCLNDVEIKLHLSDKMRVSVIQYALFTLFSITLAPFQRLLIVYSIWSNLNNVAFRTSPCP